MSCTVSDKLLETFFLETLTEKAEMLKKHLKGHQQQSSDMCEHWAKYSHI